MLDKNSPENVFRFLQLRPPVAPEPGLTINLPSTDFILLLANQSSAERTRVADEHLRTHHQLVEEIVASDLFRSTASLSGSQGTVELLLTRWHETGGDLSEVKRDHAELSEYLAAAKFASTGHRGDTEGIARVFRIFAALVETPETVLLTSPAARYLRLPIALPSAFSTPRTLTATNLPGGRELEAEPGSVADDDLVGDASELQFALEDIAGVAFGDALTPFADNGRNLLALTARGVASLAPETRTTLASRGLDLQRAAITDVLARLESAVASARSRAVLAAARRRMPRQLPVPAAQQPTRPYIRSVGVADLLVVKQHLLRYERTDIAHIENILAGEKKSRNFRTLACREVAKGIDDDVHSTRVRAIGRGDGRLAGVGRTGSSVHHRLA